MKLFDLVTLSINSICSNPLRSFLSSLGVFMGVFAISGTLQVSDIGRIYLRKQIEEMESPQILLYSPTNLITSEQKKYQLEDIKWLQKNLTNWSYIIPLQNGGNLDILYKKQTVNTQIQAITPEFLPVSGRKIIAGSFLNINDLEKQFPVIIIDEVVSKNLFKGENSLGKMLYFQNKSYYIKGVIESKKIAPGSEKQGLILIPLSLYQSLKSSPFFEQIIITPSQSEDLETIKNQAIKLLQKRFKNHDISAYSNIETVKMLEKSLTIVTIILLIIGGISLVVGGVGIANITIASIVERTSEIGLRRAIGATKKEILTQILLESTMITITGGILASGIVQITTFFVVKTLKLPYQFNYQITLISLSSAIFVGISSSFLPAKKASELDPVKALKS
jgi:putative ABC transport system permease protein